MSKKLLLLLGFLLLAACTVRRTPSPSPAGTAATGSVAIPAEGDDLEPQIPVPLTGTGGLAEALLPTGFLSIGNADAPVTLLLWTHPSCRYCQEFLDRQLPRLTEDFLRPGTVRLQIGFLPLRKYPQSQTQAASFLCAAAQGKGFPTLLGLFEGSTEEMSVAKVSFNECMTSPRTQELLTLHASLARALDVTLVPTFFLNGEKMTGLSDYPDLRGAIQEALDEKKN